MATDRSQSGMPKVVAVLPRALLDLFPGAAKEVEMRASTIDGLIDGLDARWPGMRDRLCDSTPRIRQHLSIFCDGERANLDTVLPPDAKIYVLTAMSGG